MFIDLPEHASDSPATWLSEPTATYSPDTYTRVSGILVYLDVPSLHEQYHTCDGHDQIAPLPELTLKLLTGLLSDLWHAFRGTRISEPSHVGP